MIYIYLQLAPRGLGLRTASSGWRLLPALKARLCPAECPDGLIAALLTGTSGPFPLPPIGSRVLVSVQLDWLLMNGCFACGLCAPEFVVVVTSLELRLALAALRTGLADEELSSRGVGGGSGS